VSECTSVSILYSVFFSPPPPHALSLALSLSLSLSRPLSLSLFPCLSLLFLCRSLSSARTRARFLNNIHVCANGRVGSVQRLGMNRPRTSGAMFAATMQVCDMTYLHT